MFAKEPAGVGGTDALDGLGRSLRHHLAALSPAFWSQVDHPIRRSDDVEVVLDHHRRVALLDELVQDVEEVLRVVEVQAGGRLVEDVERPACPAPRQLAGVLED
jgi:hypothetical protein